MSVYQFTGRSLTKIDVTGLPIGQRVLQVNKHEQGVICETSPHGYTVIFPDGSESHGQTVNSISPFTKIQVLEGVALGSEVQHLIQLRDAKRVTDRWDREEAARLHTLEVEKITAQLRERYPWATKTRYGSADASKNLKTELSKAFPGIKFSVRSDHNSINVRWVDGPSSKQVKEISDKYQNGDFNGMEDIHEYDHSAFGEAVDIVLGRAKYVFEYREFSDALIQKAIDRVAAEYSRTAQDDVTVARFRNGLLYNTSPLEGGNGSDHWSYQRLIGRELDKLGMMPAQGTK